MDDDELLKFLSKKGNPANDIRPMTTSFEPREDLLTDGQTRKAYSGHVLDLLGEMQQFIQEGNDVTKPLARDMALFAALQTQLAAGQGITVLASGYGASMVVDIYPSNTAIMRSEGTRFGVFDVVRETIPNTGMCKSEAAVEDYKQTEVFVVPSATGEKLIRLHGTDSEQRRSEISPLEEPALLRVVTESRKLSTDTTPIYMNAERREEEARTNIPQPK